MSGVQVQNVHKSFGGQTVVKDVTIDFPDKGFYTLLGPSGSGKTTILRMIAGFEIPNSGNIRIDGQDVVHMPVEKRGIGMVFQNYALFGNMNVFENIAFGLRIRSVGGSEITKRVAEVLELVRLTELRKRRISQLSGGQKQRIALARALITKPRVLLLDEPLSALDRALRMEMQLELKRIQRDVGVTTIFVTHDQEEALTLSDQIGILNQGQMVQEGRPLDIYERPNSVFSAAFLGEANFFRGSVEDEGIRVDAETHFSAGSAPGNSGQKVVCAVRPEKIRIELADSAKVGSPVNSVLARITKHVFAGNSLTYYLEYNGRELKVFAQNQSGSTFVEGMTVQLSWSPSDTIILDDNADSH